MHGSVLVLIAYALSYIDRGCSVNGHSPCPVKIADNVLYPYPFAVSPPVAEEHLSVIVYVVPDLLGNVPRYLSVCALCGSRHVRCLIPVLMRLCRAVVRNRNSEASLELTYGPSAFRIDRECERSDPVTVLDKIRKREFCGIASRGTSDRPVCCEL